MSFKVRVQKVRFLAPRRLDEARKRGPERSHKLREDRIFRLNPIFEA
ncbi:hypothetical protein [Radiobacillus sp. PE A8.2]